MEIRIEHKNIFSEFFFSKEFLKSFLKKKFENFFIFFFKNFFEKFLKSFFSKKNIYRFIKLNEKNLRKVLNLAKVATSSKKNTNTQTSHLSSLIFHLSKSIHLSSFIILLIFFTPILSSAQGDLKIGDWQLQLPYHTGKLVTQSETDVYWSTGYSIAKMNKSDFTFEALDKLSGLSNVDIAFLRYNKSLKSILVFYLDNSIDIVNEGGKTYTLSDVKDNTTIAGDKKVYDVVFSGNIAYIAYGFGVVALDMQRAEFKFTLFTYQAVTGITLLNGNLYLATPSGIYFAQENTTANLADFKNWQPYTINGKTISKPTFIKNYNNQLYFNAGDSLSTIQNGQIKNLYVPVGYPINSITAEGKNLVVTFRNTQSSKIITYDAAGNYKDVSNNCAGLTNYAIQDAQGRLYVGDEYLYFRFKNNENATQCQWTEFNSPAGFEAGEFAITDSIVWATTAAFAGAGPRDDQGYGFSSFKDGKWRNYNQFTDAKMNSGYTLDDYSVKINPLNSKVYIGSVNSGLIELTNNEISNLYNNKNSPIANSPDDPGRLRVSGLAIDKSSNLWVVNGLAANPLLILKPDGTWLKLRTDVPRNIHDITTDSLGYHWCIIGGAASGMLVYDAGKTIDDISDDRYAVIDNSILPSDLQGANINCISTDRDGTLWLGTSNGVCRLDCSDPFSSGCRGKASLIISSLGGVNEYLLREKNVNTIAIDGANQKWFGTNNGIFVTSSDGKTEVVKFNTDNSPLPSNNITAINFRNSTGEVFIGTDKGLVIYRSTATAGSDRNTSQAYAFPNPVRPDYNGVIAIKGLARDANVKITDAIGNLVYETKALGGQAIWDGKDFSGRHVSSGVYLALSTNTHDIENPDTVVVKILVMK